MWVRSIFNKPNQLNNEIVSWLPLLTVSKFRNQKSEQSVSHYSSDNESDYDESNTLDGIKYNHLDDINLQEEEKVRQKDQRLTKTQSQTK